MVKALSTLRSKLNSFRDLLFRSLFRARFRYDVFISYSHRDAKEYAANLKDQLSRLDFSCFIDKEESPPGSSLDPTLAKALRKSAVLVLLATERALTRPYIVSEFEKFAATGRRIIPINICDALSADDDAALDRAPWNIIKSRNLIWIDEDQVAFAKQVPSPQIADGIDKQFKYTRRNSRVRTEIVATSMLALVLALAAGLVIKDKAAEVSKQSALAQQATQDAATQQTIAGVAKQEAECQLDLAKQAKDEADQAKAEAAKAKSDASTQQEVARKATSEANKQLALAKTAKAEADRQRAIAAQQLERSQHLAYDSDINLAQRAYESDDITRLSELMNANSPASETPGQPDFRSFDWFYLRHLYDSEQKRLPGYSGPLAFFPTDNRLAISSDDGTLKFLNLVTPEERIPLKELRSLQSVTFSPDGRLMLTDIKDGPFKLWDLTADPPRELATILDQNDKPNPQGRLRWLPIQVPRFSKNGKTLAILTRAYHDDTFEDSVRLWDTAEREERQPIKVKTTRNEESTIDLSPDGNILVFRYGDRMGFWDVRGRTPLELEQLRQQQDSLSFAATFSADSKTLATEDSDNSVRLWDLSANNPRQRAILEKARWHLFGAFTPDGTRLVLVDYDGTVELWDAKTDQPAQSQKLTVDLGRATNNYPTVAFSTDGHTLAIWKGNGLIKLVRITTEAQELATLSLPSGPQQPVEFSATGKYFAALSQEGTMKVWDVGEQSEMGPLKAVASGITELKFSPDGKTLAAVANDKSLRVWDMSSSRVDPMTYHSRMYVASDALSPAASILAFGTEDQRVRLSQTDSLTSPVVLRGEPKFAVRHLAFSSDGRTLAGATVTGILRLWQVDTPDREPKLLDRKGGPIRSLVFSPDGRELAVVTDSGMVELWETTKSEVPPPRTFPAAAGSLVVAFSRNGKALLLKDNNGNVELWDTEHLDRQKIIATQIRIAAKSLDGKTVITVSEHGDIKLWDTSKLEVQASLRTRAPDLSAAALSPDGKVLALGNADAVKLIDVYTGQELLTLKARWDWHKYSVDSLEFSHDGQLLIARNGPYEFTLWYAPANGGKLGSKAIE